MRFGAVLLVQATQSRSGVVASNDHDVAQRLANILHCFARCQHLLKSGREAKRNNTTTLINDLQADQQLQREGRYAP
jgi:hypothetical protein